MRAKALADAAKALLGADFVLIPEFEVLAGQGAEFEKALARGQEAGFLAFLNGSGVDFPLDEWLYGVARVRDKMRIWEETVMLTGGFGLGEPELVLAQLPVVADEQWLALTFPDKPEVSGERLLYTACYSAPFAKAARQCGLIVDEWSEVIPADETTTGIAFHYDRPNSEPPQTMLLVTPTDVRGKWQWADLVDALNETLDMAKKRAVEPAQIDAGAYARFLPATITAVTLSGLAMSMNLAVSNDFNPS